MIRAVIKMENRGHELYQHRSHKKNNKIRKEMLMSMEKYCGLYEEVRITSNWKKEDSVYIQNGKRRI